MAAIPSPSPSMESSPPTPTPTLTPSSTPDASNAYFLVYACIYALGSVYLVPCGMCACRLVRNWRRDTTAVRLFTLLGLGAFVRALAFILVSAWMFGVIESHGSHGEAIQLHMSYLQLVTMWQVLGMIASLLLVTVFLLILMTWASMIEQVETPMVSIRSNAQAHVARTVFVKLVVGLYALQLTAFLLVDAVPDSLTAFCQSLNLVATLMLALCFIVCMFLLPAYGSRMCKLLGKVAEGADRRQRNIRRIAATATVFCLMRTVSQVLSAAAQYVPSPDEDNGSGESHASFVAQLHPRHIIEANPLFFFTSDGLLSSTNGYLHWVVFIEVIEFPLEWMLLLCLLWVLPSRTALPTIRGYQAIPDRKWRL